MILLFNKIYLKVDQLYKMERNRIVISKEFAGMAPLTDNFTAKVNQVQVKSALHEVRTLSELVDTFYDGKFDNFFNMLLAHDATERLTIYCDSEAMLELLLRFWKTLFPRLDDDSFYTLLNFTVSQIVEVLGIGFLSFTKLHQAQSQNLRDNYSPLLLPENKQAMLDKWKATPGAVLSRTNREKIIKSCGLEYQLASVLTNDKWRHKQVFQTKVVKMFFKELITEFILDIKYMLLDGLVGFHYFEPSTSYDFFKDTLEDLVSMHPNYKFLTDDRFVPDEIEYILANYQLSDLLEIRKKTYDAQHYYSLDWDNMYTNALTFADILAHDASTPTVNLFMKRGEYQERVNPYMVDYIFQAYRSGNKSLLAPFELV